MLAETTTRVEKHTNQAVQDQLHQRLVDNVSLYLDADQSRLDRRIEELDREWNIERAIEVEAPLMIGLGAALGLLSGRKWYALSGVAAAMVVLHNTNGWYPLLPILRRLGFRTQREINAERDALRVLRKDHRRYMEH